MIGHSINESKDDLFLIFFPLVFHAFLEHNTSIHYNIVAVHLKLAIIRTSTLQIIMKLQDL